jgi:hypothetical protein
MRFPDDFWEALKSGDTSDPLFWASIGILLGVLCVIFCVIRCCIWCFDSSKDDAKYEAEHPPKPPHWLEQQAQDQHNQQVRPTSTQQHHKMTA